MTQEQKILAVVEHTLDKVTDELPDIIDKLEILLKNHKEIQELKNIQSRLVDLWDEVDDLV
jgi:hypothetical protein